MASSFESFRELNLSRDEVEKLTDALKDKKFRQLLTEYVDEVRDPENQKRYQREIAELEKQRGVDVTFINPAPGYVLKTSANGSRKAFINVCSNEHVGKPTASPAEQDGARGLQWKLPHSLAPPREDMDNKRASCLVYDVVFHPDTLHLAQKNKAFRDLVNTTACDAIESNFDVTLDRKNLKFPKLQYKGFPHAAVIRKPSAEKPPPLNPDDQEIMDKLFAQAGIGECPLKSPKKCRKSPKKGVNANDTSSYTTPIYVIKHRRHIELEEFTEHKTSKLHSAIPKELIVEVNLPLLKSSADIVLDVAEKTLQLISEKPAKYKLVLTLPYQVNQDSGNAKFDKDQKKLIVTLPVKAHAGLTLIDVIKDDSGVESDHGSLMSSSPVDEIDPLVTEIDTRENPIYEPELLAKTEDSTKATFLDPNLLYSLPEHTAHVLENTIAFTLNVKNVDESSISKIVNESATAIHIKFSSISSGFYSLHYAIYIKFCQPNIETDKISIEIWDNNVVVQINYSPPDKIVTSYFCGLDEHSLFETFLQEPSIINDMYENMREEFESSCSISKDQKPEGSKHTGAVKKEVRNRKDKKKSKTSTKRYEACNSFGSQDVETTETEEDEEKVKSEDENPSEIKQSTAIDIAGAFSECSSDEVSYSFSPTKSRGILKGFSSSRRFGRSISESGLDDMSLTSSIENCCYTSVDSVIPEEGEMSTSLKKTVRFNNVVSRQLFRSNSSILGQRKKNQRKAKAKKRAQERRHSEGEISENEEKKERDAETIDETKDDEGKEDSVESKSDDIFEFDMNF